jgi:glycosyltransferase involved in cell wall biosynthesis
MISVCVATYNGEKYIKEQLDSILIQISEIDEILISDDGSTDDTIAILESYKDIRIKVYKNNFKNHIQNFEFLLFQAKGDFVFLSDQDDVWLKNKVEVSLSYLKKFDLILADCYIVDSDLNVIRDTIYFNEPRIGLLKNFYKNIYTGCCLAFRKEVLKYALPFPAKINSHDTWLGLVCEMFFRVALIPEKLILFRRHGENFSTNNSKDSYITKKSHLSIFTILKSRLFLGLYLLRLYLNYNKSFLVKYFYYKIV